MATSHGSGGQNHDRIDIDMADDARSVVAVVPGLQPHLEPGVPNGVEERDLMDTAPDQNLTVEHQIAPVQGTSRPSFSVCIEGTRY